MGYPIGSALPLLALSGGGLLEFELHSLTESVIAHAVSNIDVGPLAFELSTIAAEKATELVHDRVAAAKRRAERPEKQAARDARKQKNALIAAKKLEADKKAAERAAEAAATAQSELKVAPKHVNTSVDLVGDMLNGGGVDKGGYKKKKK